ncbi:sigma factor [Nocardia sp. NPDC050712]|uniref:sigma factor n=1 Tax=Nocardia sp. NPDC050712 TaxID=3155518 RepID=UPI0033CCF91F
MESDGLHEFQAHRPRLFALAYRMLGSAREAEDTVRETALRWNGTGRGTIRAAEVWLTATVVNLCRARLVSARTHRAAYAGPWLPEPVPTAGGALGPLESAEERAQVSLAVLTVLERLEPEERAAFVLRESFAYAHREIADMLALTEADILRSYRRACAWVRESKGRFVFPGDSRMPAERLLKAARTGDADEVARLLAEDVVVTADSGGREPAAARPITGAEPAACYLAGLIPPPADGLEVAVEEINGAFAVVARLRRRPMLVLDVDAGEGGLHAVRVVLSPAKLAYFAGLTS